MDELRLKHSYAVGKKMQEIGKEKGLSEEEIKELFVLGLNHDIGYEFTDNGINHNIIGGEVLKSSGYQYWREVYYHGELDIDYQSLFLDILNMADMQVDRYGNDVGYDKRLEDIATRYGAESHVYKKCEKLISNIRNLAK